MGNRAPPVARALPALLCQCAGRDRADRPLRPAGGGQPGARRIVRHVAAGPDRRAADRLRQRRGPPGDCGQAGRRGRRHVAPRAGRGAPQGPARPRQRRVPQPARRHRGRRRADAAFHRRHRAEEPRSAIRAIAEDAGGRSARRRRRARLQQPADRDDRVLRPAVDALPAGRPVLRRHHADQAERQPRRQPGAPAPGLLAPADPAAAHHRHHRRAGRAVAPACAG